MWKSPIRIFFFPSLSFAYEFSPSPFWVMAETALKLDTLIGDVEDAVSSSMTSNLKRVPSVSNSEVRSMKDKAH